MTDEELDMANIWQRPGYLIRRLSQIHHAIFNDVLSGEITPLQYGLLTVLSTQQGLDQTELTVELGTDRTTLAATIELLEKRALLSRDTHFSDRRRKVVNITLKGKRLLEKTQQQMHDAQQQLLAPLPPEARRQFVAMMKVLVEGNNHITSVSVKYFEQRRGAPRQKTISLLPVTA